MIPKNDPLNLPDPDPRHTDECGGDVDCTERRCDLCKRYGMQCHIRVVEARQVYELCHACRGIACKTCEEAK